MLLPLPEKKKQKNYKSPVDYCKRRSKIMFRQPPFVPLLHTIQSMAGVIKLRICMWLVAFTNSTASPSNASLVE